MATEEDLRAIVATLDAVEEIPSEGFDFRTRGKGFVWSWPQRVPGRRRVIRTDVAVLHVGDEAERQALVQGEPDLFDAVPGAGERPVVLVYLERVDVGRLTELVTDAWQMRHDE